MVYFFYGDDNLSLLRELQAAKEQFLQKTPRGRISEFEVDADLTEQDLLHQLREQLESQDLFAPQKLIIARNLFSKIADHPKAQSYLETALPKLPKHLEVIFVAGPELDRRGRFFKKLKSLAETKEFAVPDPARLAAWIKRRLKDESFVISPDALAKLVSLFGEDYELWQVDNEINKLILYCLEKKTIAAADVEAVVAAALPAGVFELTNLVAQNQTRDAILVLERLLQGQTADLRTQTVQIVGALAAQIRSLLMVKSLEETKADPADLAQTLGWKPGRVFINLKLARGFSQSRLLQLLQDLKAIDLRLKTSEESPKLLLMLFIQKAAA